MRHSKLMFVFGIVMALLGLAGCAKIRYPSYYVLNLPAPSPDAAGSKPILGSVAVREFSAPEFLRRGPIAYRQSPEQLDFYHYDQWAEDPRSAVTAAMVREMRVRGLFQSVGVFDAGETPECLLTGKLDHLEEVDQGSSVSIEVGLSARLINLRTGEVLWQGASSKTAKLDQRSVPGIVAAMSRELGDTVQALVSSMQDHVSAAPLSSKANTEQ
jgi:uncharacterized lipoprotein YmbA